jgi:hypothetical protein
MSFVEEELDAADAHRFAVSSLEVARDSSTITVVTVEGQKLVIRISVRGFEVVESHPPVLEVARPTETLQALLSSISPGYCAAFSKQLADKLLSRSAAT